MPTDARDPARRPDDRLSTPYGPHDHVDETAGGADSSPLEDVPTGEQQKAADTDERQPRAKPKG
jgi:hypothetical protein